jgi:hypothetical protein
MGHNTTTPQLTYHTANLHHEGRPALEVSAQGQAVALTIKMMVPGQPSHRENLVQRYLAIEIELGVTKHDMRGHDYFSNMQTIESQYDRLHQYEQALSNFNRQKGLGHNFPGGAYRLSGSHKGRASLYAGKTTCSTATLASGKPGSQGCSSVIGCLLLTLAPAATVPGMPRRGSHHPPSLGRGSPPPPLGPRAGCLLPGLACLA